MSRNEAPQNEWRAALDTETCCTGACNDNQGRGYCPRHPEPEPPATSTDLALAVVIVAALAVFALLGPAGLHLIARVFA